VRSVRLSIQPPPQADSMVPGGRSLGVGSLPGSFESRLATGRCIIAAGKTNQLS
jgi:hypothetical protein